VGFNINVKKTKAMVHSRRPGRKGTLTVEDHNIRWSGYLNT
jgi:hypothetical protein